MAAKTLGMTDRPQSFANHRALPSPVFIATSLVLAGNIGLSIWFAWRDPGLHTIWTVVLAIALFLAAVVGRRCAQVVQDRIIRLEMCLRLERLLPGRQADLARLKLSQLVALRFAGDAELPGLVEAVLRGELTTPDQIKMKITDWQADWLRV
jgi:hypothetical protein